MRVHHLNCMSMCAAGGPLMDGRLRPALRARLSCHCLLLEGSEQLVLIDTGFGLRDVVDPELRLSAFFRRLNRPELRAELSAVRQIERLGFDPADVRHIVLTHLDFDHAGGLDDFPGATVHLLEREIDSALARDTALDRMRYRPQQWHVRNLFRGYEPGGDAWFGFECVRELVDVEPDVALVPLVGHTLGHAGVAIRRDDGTWLLHAGDAYFHRGEMDPERPHCTPGLRMYQRLMEKDRRGRLRNQRRLRELRRIHGAEIQIVCAHDPVEFERCAGRPLDQPAEPEVLPGVQGAVVLELDPLH